MKLKPIEWSETESKLGEIIGKTEIGDFIIDCSFHFYCLSKTPWNPEIATVYTGYETLEEIKQECEALYSQVMQRCFIEEHTGEFDYTFWINMENNLTPTAMLQTFKDYFYGYVGVNPLLQWLKFTEVNERGVDNLIMCRRTERILPRVQDKQLATQILASKLVSELESYIGEILWQRCTRPEVTITETTRVIKLVLGGPYHIESDWIDFKKTAEDLTPACTKVAVFNLDGYIPIDMYIGESITGEPGLWLRESKDAVQAGFAFALPPYKPNCIVTEFGKLKPSYD